MATLENGRTLVAALDESLIPDDFEVIERHVDPTNENDPLPIAAPAPNASVSQWSIQQSITLDGNMSINTLPHMEEEKTLQKETPVLDGSVVETPAVQESLRSELEETMCSSWGSNDTLNSMLASQAETKQLLESSIAKIETMREELSQLDELKQTVEMLKQELARKAEPTTRPTRNNSLEEDLYQKGLEIDQRENTLTALRGELDASQRTIADLQNTAKYLNDQLDEMCAKYLHEKELRAVVEEQLNAQQQGRRPRHNLLCRRRSGLSSPVLYDESAAARELSSKSELLEKKEKEIKNLDEELKNQNEIIKVLREDHLEGNRQLAEKDHKISELEKIMKAMDERLMMDSS